jgi:TolA-binding protein
MKRVLFLVSSSMLFVMAEPSVYSDVDFVDAETIAKKNSREIFLLKEKIANLNEKIEGLKTLLNSQENQILRLKQKTNNNYADIINKLSQKVAQLEYKVNMQKYNPPSIKTPTTYSLEDKQEQTKEIKQELKKEQEKELKLSNKELYKKAVLDFNNKRFTSAKRIFKQLLLKGYKAAESNFYLGEIAFYRKQYKDAISYYQNSATLNEDAIYMDKLLLHTAIALKKIGKTTEAKNFLKAIVASYPDTPSAKEAKKYLK